jgi:PKD repeat protein
MPPSPAFWTARTPQFVLALHGLTPATPAILDATALSDVRVDGHYTDAAGLGTTHTLEYTPQGGSPATQVVRGGVFSVTGLTANTQYAFRLKAATFWGVSDWTPVVTVTTQASPQAPLADFSADTTGPAVGQTVTMTDLSTGTPQPTTTFDYGDGTAPTTTPTHAYAAAGTYTVSATAVNTSGSNTKTRSNFVLTRPLADFTADVTAGPVGTTVTLTNLSAGTVDSVSVDWGDGTVNSSLTHAYATSGVFTIALTATNASGPNTKTRTSYVTVNPVAGWTQDVAAGYAPLAVQFTNTSQGSGLSYAWDFGDGGTSTSASPLHTYANAGNYTVVLTVTDAAGHTGKFTQPNAVAVGTAFVAGTVTYGADPLAYAGDGLTYGS